MSYPAAIDLALKQGSAALVEELHALLRSLDVGARAPEVISEHVDAVGRRLRALRRRAPSDAMIVALLDRLREVLSQYVPEAATWDQLRSQLSESYESLTRVLSAEDPDAPARPVNYARSGFHIASALACLLLAGVVLTPQSVLWVTAAFALSAWSAEISRRVSPRANALMMRFFRHVAHPTERGRVNSATWYATAMFALGVSGSTIVQVTAVAVLGFGDPVAGLVGRRLGRTRLINGRSLEGTLSFVVVASVVAFGALGIVRPELGAQTRALVAVAASLGGGVAELLSRRVDDNLSIPLVAGAVAFIGFVLLGVPL